MSHSASLDKDAFNSLFYDLVAQTHTHTHTHTPTPTHPHTHTHTHTGVGRGKKIRENVYNCDFLPILHILNKSRKSEYFLSN